MMPAFPPVDSRDDVTSTSLAEAIHGLKKPMVFKGVVDDWPVVQAARQGDEAVIDYLKACDNRRPAETFRQMPGDDGKFFYGKDQAGFNFARAPLPISVTLERLRSLLGQDGAEPIYIQSALLENHMPRLKAEVALPGIAAEPRIWIGNRSQTQIHFDLYENLACMVAGAKRFVLFPPDQVANLYMGPFETTVSGVPTSMVDFDTPDFTAHPRFADALMTATVADLEPGDVLYIPYMWWHHVSSSADINVQINSWWNPAPADRGAPIHALFHAMLALRDLPAPQVTAWRAMFDHFVFSGPTGDHLRPEMRGLQGQLTPEQRSTIRNQLGRNLLED